MHWELIYIITNRFKLVEFTQCTPERRDIFQRGLMLLPVICPHSFGRRGRQELSERSGEELLHASTTGQSHCTFLHISVFIKLPRYYFSCSLVFSLHSSVAILVLSR